ncbi:hypothetical protein SKAU_G00043590 [Synaphobranchus kaupii]|uniref:Uncharacterized protein n=1 Tax=Synaphobranchus kaupii TaxID=118154 RepID=A0A9Q1G2L9_SYNKA|nr:hypothetical protein SKAU_G00043590 [Synaphobranchus kaupii]
MWLTIQNRWSDLRNRVLQIHSHTKHVNQIDANGLLLSLDIRCVTDETQHRHVRRARREPWREEGQPVRTQRSAETRPPSPAPPRSEPWPSPCQRSWRPDGNSSSSSSREAAERPWRWMSTAPTPTQAFTFYNINQGRFQPPHVHM